MKFSSEHISIKNTKKIDKPNEDFCICDDENGIYILLDGVSRDVIDGKYPTPSPAACVSEIFAVNTHTRLLEILVGGGDYQAIVKDAIRFGNECVANFNSGGSYSFLPGTVGIVLLIRDNKAYFGFIGDCVGKVISIDNSRIFTRCQTEYVHKHKSLYTASEIRNHICNNIDHPAGYGVLNGIPEALDFVELGQLELSKGEKILLYTDGFEDVIDSRSSQQLYELSVCEAKRLSEPKGDEYIDDRTLLIIPV